MQRDPTTSKDTKTCVCHESPFYPSQLFTKSLLPFALLTDDNHQVLFGLFAGHFFFSKAELCHQQLVLVAWGLVGPHGSDGTHRQTIRCTHYFVEQVFLFFPFLPSSLTVGEYLVVLPNDFLSTHLSYIYYYAISFSVCPIIVAKRLKSFTISL